MASVRFVTTWGAAAAALAVLLGLAGCSGGDDDGAPTTTEQTTTSSTTTEPERPASTTTTAYDPATVEGQVEAAYLRSWDVYADAVYRLELDEEALADVYAEDGLTNVTADVAERVRDRRAAHVVVEHRYEVVLTNDSLANVIEQLVNHQVLIDPVTKEPLEEDPNEPQLLNFVMKRFGDQWKVTLVKRVGS